MRTKSEYDAAKAEYAGWTDAQHADPTPAMLEVVELINAYERALDEQQPGPAPAHRH